MNAKNVFAFIAGIAVGSFVTWKWTKKEIYTYSEEFAETEEEEIESEEPVEEKQAPWRIEKPDLLEYAAKLKEMRYANNEKVEEEGGVEPMDHEKPYVISPDDFGEEDDYESVSLFYHADGVLTFTNNEVVENVDELVGEESLTHFGEYEDDSVFVRNDDLRTDFEILLDPSNFNDSGSEPHADEE